MPAFAFITGSRVYGIPHDESDVDLVIPCSSATAFDLTRYADNKREVYDRMDADNRHESGGCHTPSLRFGVLNLICVLEKDEWIIWKSGTEYLCKQKRKITRREAGKFFARMRYHKMTAEQSAAEIDWNDPPPPVDYFAEFAYGHDDGHTEAPSF